MTTMSRLLPLLLSLLLLQVSLLAAQPALPEPDAASIQLIPSTSAAAAGGSSSSSSPPATIPAFPEQSDVSTAACPLDPPADLLPSVSAACGASDGSLPSRSRCCPTLNAWLLAAYSASALAAHPLPSSGYDLPALPDDSEACIGGVERALRDRGVELPRVNGTCDAAYCYCGVRLRRLACAGAFVVDAAEGRWVPAGDAGRRLERDCSRSGFAGCTRCLRSLNQVSRLALHPYKHGFTCIGTRVSLCKNSTFLWPRELGVYLHQPLASLSSDATRLSQNNDCSKITRPTQISVVLSSSLLTSLSLNSLFSFDLCVLWQLKSEEKRGIGNATRWDKKAGPTQDRECQLMGLTWLLSKNRTHFLPAATSVLRVLMAADGVGGPDPTSCTLSLDDMPLAVGSDQIDSRGGSCAVRSLPLFQLFLLTTFVLFALFHV
ncbi:hypothetical protein BHE74_00025045 [Ensete ventricosum]|nr:hypothetical protein BHE74_00025045 [Ensete ventricosum]